MYINLIKQSCLQFMIGLEEEHVFLQFTFLLGTTYYSVQLKKLIKLLDATQKK